MNINRPLMPGFLKRAEQKLLLNKPLIWSTRVHLVLYYGILYNIFLAALSFLAPLDVMERSQAPYWIGFQVIIAIIALTVWLIYLLRFNVFKKYGNIKPMHALVSFLLYFISTGIIILSVFIYPMVECVRANLAFDGDEMVQDINNINIKICQVEHKLLNVSWDYDTLVADKSIKVDSFPDQTDEVDTMAAAVTAPPLHAFRKVDTAGFRNQLAVADSVIRLNDTMYVVYETPDLQFVYGYMLEEYSHQKLLSSFRIYNKALKHIPAPAELGIIAKELKALESKYENNNKPANTVSWGDELPENGTFEIIHARHPIGSINTSIDNIASKKYGISDRHFAESIRVFFYFTLGITLLIFIFRNSTARTFFITLLSGVLLTILTSMVMAFSNANGANITGWLIGYTLIFFAGSVFTFSSSKRSMLNGIFINLFLIMVPVLPLLLVDFIYELNKDEYYKKYGSYYGQYSEQYFLYAEITGVVLLLVLLATYINRVYRRWYSLPEN